MRFHNLEDYRGPVAEPRRIRDPRARQTGWSAERLSQQERQTFPRPAQAKRRVQGRVRLRAQRSGKSRRSGTTGGFFRTRTAWQMPKMRRACVRVRNELCLRKFSRSKQNV